MVDIAGLVRGAAEGQGLGNAFLSHIKACDAIFNLCRKFLLNYHDYFCILVIRSVVILGSLNRRIDFEVGERTVSDY